MFQKVALAEIPKPILKWFNQTKVQDYKLIYSYFKRLYNKTGCLQIHTISINETELDLYKTKLTCIPDSIGQLTQLQHLNVSENQLTCLPDSIGQLTQLQSLDLSENQLTCLPDSIGQLTQLRNLIYLKTN